MNLILVLLLITQPNPVITPGATRLLTQETICNTIWHLDQRHVTERMKKNVADDYEVDWAERAKYEFDHLIPRSLGGADVENNIWPQSRSGVWSARKKDNLEIRLGKLVCAGKLPLKTAQDDIRRDWIAAYKKYVGPK